MQSPFSFLRLFSLGAVFVIVPLSVRAQTGSETDWNHFGLNFRAAFNIGAKFSEPSLNGGFVRKDSSDDAGGVTWNWGYQNLSHLNGANLEITDAQAASERTTGDPNLGLDFNYVRDIAHDSWGQWGIKFGFGYTDVDIHDKNPLGVNETSTDYPLNGVMLPQKPYIGSYNGPGPVIGSTGTPLPNSVMSIPGTRTMDGSLFDLRLGPAVNIPLFKRFSLQAGGGFALGVVNSHFSFSESIAGAPATGSSTRTGVVPGAYAELGFAYRVCHSASLFTGAQFEYLGDFNQSADGRGAQLDLGATIFYELGLEWHF